MITITGNLTNDPELKFTPKGDAVASFTVAVSKRVKEGDKWVDGPSSFYRCSIWRQYAENIAETLTKGSRVIVTGEMRQREYEDKQGEKRQVWELQAEEVGVSLRYATATVRKAERVKTGVAAANAAADDPWATPMQTDVAPF